MNSAAATQTNTRQRLLQAATEVFVEVGYRDATFREICRRAEANNAAINYHFRDKDHLYRAVIEQAIDQVQDGLPQAQVDWTAPPADKLRAFVRATLVGCLVRDTSNLVVQVISRELDNPTSGMDLVIERLIKPVHAALGKIIRELANPAATDQQISDCLSSIIGQCKYYSHVKPFAARLGPYSEFDQATIAHLADHITRFSLAGIRALPLS